MIRALIPPFVIVAAGLAGAGAVHAETSDQPNEKVEARAVLDARTSLAEAVKSAEASVRGKASSVNIVTDDGTSPFYHVEVIAADGTQHDLAVDVRKPVP